MDPDVQELAATESPANCNEAPVQTADEHASLKYSLLGPSLTKAGQDKVDQAKVCRVFLAICGRLPTLVYSSFLTTLAGV